MSVTRRGALLGGVAVASFASVRVSAEPVVHIAVTKGPGCDCCDAWASHLRANGYSVSATESDDLDNVKKKLGIPDDLWACHTGQIGRYLVEGHVPAVAIGYLLRQKPVGMIGVAVPGMPVGSPGMDVPKGAKQDEYSVILFGPAGRKTWARFKGTTRI